MRDAPNVARSGRSLRLLLIARALSVSSLVIATGIVQCPLFKAEVWEASPSRDLRNPDGGGAGVPAYPDPLASLVDRAWALAVVRPNRRRSITIHQGARPRLRRPRSRGHRQLRTPLPTCHLQGSGNVVGNRGARRAEASRNYLHVLVSTCDHPMWGGVLDVQVGCLDD